ncbi:MAG: sulfatase [Thermoanaerobaculia bacterium]|nr:sulfatase [Thermoanaerobaculia bacterium]
MTSLLLGLFLVGCGATAETPPNILLITVDTLRWDRLGLYGYERETTPEIDRFFSRGRVFWNAATPAPCTIPAVAQLLTGRYFVEEASPTLTSLLGGAGYRTAAVVSRHHFRASTVFARAIRRGFDRFDIQGPDEVDRHGHSTRSADEVTQRGFNVLRELRTDDRPFFLWLHYFDPHDPYTPPSRFSSPFDRGNQSERGGDRRSYLQTERASPDQPWQRAGAVFDQEDVRHLRNLYDGEIRFVDYELGKLLRHVSREGLLETTIVGFTSDHGEWLGEGNRWDHCQTLAEEEIRVPLLVRSPKGPLKGEGDVTDPVGLLDLVPTLLRLAGRDSAGLELDGGDLWELPRRDLVFSYWIRAVSARSADLKLIRKRGREPLLYELDPAELRGRRIDPETRPGGARRLDAANREFLRRHPSIDVQSAEVLEKLRSVGYID